jgi:AraC-like DNA-binding protein
MNLPNSFLEKRRLESLVENKSTFCIDNAQINVYETHTFADKVMLKFDEFVLASMIEGKKVMHLQDQSSFDFYPGESLILPKDSTMVIDFPEAKHNNPTRCLAMTISSDSINEVLMLMNESFAKSDNEWEYEESNFHFTNDAVIYRLLQRFLFLFDENHPLKDIFLDNMLKELLVRIFQLNHSESKLKNYQREATSNRISAATQYIMDNLHNSISVDDMARAACMSTPNFYKVFKNEMGLTPLAFLLQQRIRKAESLLKSPKYMIKDIYYRCGFENQSYFNRVFKKHHQLSPKEYRQRVVRMPKIII